jgi:hypothetical protein
MNPVRSLSVESILANKDKRISYLKHSEYDVPEGKGWTNVSITCIKIQGRERVYPNSFGLKAGNFHFIVRITQGQPKIYIIATCAAYEGQRLVVEEMMISDAQPQRTDVALTFDEETGEHSFPPNDFIYNRGAAINRLYDEVQRNREDNNKWGSWTGAKKDE